MSAHSGGQVGFHLTCLPERCRAPAPRIAHIGVAVSDLDAALAFYRDVLGLQPHPPETADGATIVSLPFGDSEVELLAPRERRLPIAEFLERRGPGIHHICYRVATSTPPSQPAARPATA